LSSRVWYPELVVPTASLYVFLIAIWYYSFRSRGHVSMDARLSQANTVEPDDPKEEFDAVPRRAPPLLLQIPPLETAGVEEEKHRAKERERGRRKKGRRG
jgi:hypothetical protein